MEESTNFIGRFLISGVGYGPTVRPQIAALQSLVHGKHISWGNYASRVANLVTDRSLYGQIMHFYRLQALGWALSLLAAALG